MNSSLIQKIKEAEAAKKAAEDAVNEINKFTNALPPLTASADKWGQEIIVRAKPTPEDDALLRRHFQEIITQVFATNDLEEAQRRLLALKFTEEQIDMVFSRRIWDLVPFAGVKFDATENDDDAKARGESAPDSDVLRFTWPEKCVAGVSTLLGCDWVPGCRESPDNIKYQVKEISALNHLMNFERFDALIDANDEEENRKHFPPQVFISEYQKVNRMGYYWSVLLLGAMSKLPENMRIVQPADRGWKLTNFGWNAIRQGNLGHIQELAECHRQILSQGPTGDPNSKTKSKAYSLGLATQMPLNEDGIAYARQKLGIARVGVFRNHRLTAGQPAAAA